MRVTRINATASEIIACDIYIQARASHDNGVAIGIYYHAIGQVHGTCPAIIVLYEDTCATEWRCRAVNAGYADVINGTCGVDITNTGEVIIGIGFAGTIYADAADIYCACIVYSNHRAYFGGAGVIDYGLCGDVICGSNNCIANTCAL